MVSRRYTDTLTMQDVVRFCVGLATIALVLFLLWYFSDVVIYILISAVFAIMFRPMVNVVSGVKIKEWIVPRNVAALVSLLAIWLIFGGILSTILPLIFSKIHQLANLNLSNAMNSIEEPILYVQHSIQNLLSIPESSINIEQSLIKWGRDVIDFSAMNNAFSSVIGVAASLVISFFSISFITFFFLKDDNLFFSMVTAIFPSKYNKNVERALNSITNLLSRYFVGLLFESFIITCAVSIAMICWGMQAPDAIFMGIIMGILNVIPYAGPFIGLCVSLFLAVINPIAGMSVGGTVWIVICSILIIKGLDDFLLQPTLYSERVKAHPLEVFIVILLSGYVAGIIGMLLAIPSYTVLRVFAKEFFSQYSLVQKLTKEL